MAMAWDEEQFPDEKMYAVDKVSQHAYIAMKSELPSGPYRVSSVRFF